jgi:hypothetical protein
VLSARFKTLSAWLGIFVWTVLGAVDVMDLGRFYEGYRLGRLTRPASPGNKATKSGAKRRNPITHPTITPTSHQTNVKNGQPPLDITRPFMDDNPLSISPPGMLLENAISSWNPLRVNVRRRRRLRSVSASWKRDSRTFRPSVRPSAP